MCVRIKSIDVIVVDEATNPFKTAGQAGLGLAHYNLGKMSWGREYSRSHRRQTVDISTAWQRWLQLFVSRTEKTILSQE